MVRARGFRDLPLFWKLLAPFLTLILIVGAFGAFLIVRDYSTRARATLTQSLLRSSLEARADLHDRELYLLESANLAANLEGMPAAMQSGDARRVARLLRTVLALKTDVNVVAAVTTKGAVLTEFARSGPRKEATRVEGIRWLDQPFVADAVADPEAEKRAGFVTVEGSSLLAIAAPICTKTATCAPAGAAIVGMRMERLGIEAVGNRATAARSGLGLAIFDAEGRVLTATDNAPAEPTSITLAGTDLVRQTETVDDAEVHTLYAPLDIRGQRVGMVAVSLPSDPAFGPVRGAGSRLVFILLAALAGIVGIGALLSRVILRQVRPLLETNRALEEGDLSARATVMSSDEIGEVARGLNKMADKLQSSYETLESRVADRTAEVERLLRERTEFFASLSHELRTPVAIILSEADMVLDTARNKTNKQAGATIKQSAGQLLSVVNDILDLAKAEVGELEMDLTEVRLADEFDELSPTFAGLTRGASLEVSIDVPPDLPSVRADRVRLREIIVNLIDNAVKYTPDGGSIAVSATAAEDDVCLSVTDTGPGIPDEVGDRIFEPFFRVKQTKARPGRSSTGLGLALTRRLVEAQGGEISFENSPGGGTTFTFFLKTVQHPGSNDDANRRDMKEEREGDGAAELVG